MQLGLHLRDTCTRVVASLNVERGWHLTLAQEAAYAAAVAALAKTADEATLKRVAENYHEDHVLIQALQDVNHPQHDTAWAEVRANILPVLRFAGLDRSAYPSVDLEDIAQLALGELMSSVQSFQFESRFSTWSYTIVIRRGRRLLRDMSAAKRFGATTTLDDATSSLATSSHSSDPEATALGKELTDRINLLLSEVGGARLARIFQLWFEHDLRLADIGKQVGLSTARVSVLLEQARYILQEHPEIQSWYHDWNDTHND